MQPTGIQQSGPRAILDRPDLFQDLAEAAGYPVFGVRCHAAGCEVTWSNEAARHAGVHSNNHPDLAGALAAVGCGPEVRELLADAMAGDSAGGRSFSVGGRRVVLSPDAASGPDRFVVAVREADQPGPGAGAEAPQEMLAGALDAMSAEVAIVDVRGRIVAVNAAWREFAARNGYRGENAGLGSNYLEACDNARGPAVEEARAIASGLREVLAGRRWASYVEYPCDSPEEQRWFQVRATGLDWRGGRYAVVSHESLTEAKRAEQQHRAQLDEMANHWRMSSLGELASGIAHELNQPLGAITNYMNGCLRRLEAGTIDREQLIRTVRGCAELAEFAAGIIKRMRGFASHNKCQFEPMMLNGAVSKSLQFFRASPESGRVRVHLELGVDLPSVRGDEVQIQQVALNLIRNASDAVLACGRNPARVQVSTYVDGEGMVCLAVADNGHGLPDGDEGRLFEPFFSTKSKGMGLGLSISKTIAEVHGGRLTARNVTNGDGAVFELKLPPLTRAGGLSECCTVDRGPTVAPTTIQCKSQGGAA